jgi:hypothetical protein
MEGEGKWQAQCLTIKKKQKKTKKTKIAQLANANLHELPHERALLSHTGGLPRVFNVIH